jgi:hypothetical protein
MISPAFYSFTRIDIEHIQIQAGDPPWGPVWLSLKDLFDNPWREQDSNPRSPGRDRGPAHPESGAFLSGPAEPEGVSNQRACDRTLIHISPRSRVRSGAGWAEFGGIRDPAELSTTDPPNRCHLPVWHWRVEPLDIDDSFRCGNGMGDEYYLIADFEKLL